MNLYDEYFLPHLIHCACGLKAIDQQRAKMVPLAKGRVLEVGMGSGLNLKHYNADQVELVWGLEPSRLCTIDDYQGALAEMKRVLKPSGQLVFSEHGQAPDAAVRKWQRRVNPIWKKLVGGWKYLLRTKNYFVASHGEFNLRTRLNFLVSYYDKNFCQ